VISVGTLGEVTPDPTHGFAMYEAPASVAVTTFGIPGHTIREHRHDGCPIHDSSIVMSGSERRRMRIYVTLHKATFCCAVRTRGGWNPRYMLRKP
jgi:hypothetical protein